MSNGATGADRADSDDLDTRSVVKRRRESDEREHALDAREAHIEAQEASRAERLREADGIRADADERDRQADARDRDASKRDMAAELRSWVRGDDGDGNALADREAARADRRDSKGDRISAAVERGLLTEDDDPRIGDAPESR